MKHESVSAASPRENLSTDFQYLPDYAAHLLHHDFDDYINELLRLYREADVPLFRFFKDVSADQIAAIVAASNREMLTLLASNQARRYVDQTLDSWIKNQLPIISREQVQADDITLVNFARAKAFRHFIPNYTDALNVFRELVDEIDRFFLILNAELFTAYIHLQQEEINSINTAFIQKLQESEKLHKQAQALTHIGNWSWCVHGNKISWSDEMYRIFGLEPQSEDITYERFVSFIDRADRPKRIAAIKKSLETLSVEEYHFRIRSARGDMKILRGKGEVIADEHGTPVMMLGTCQDVTHEFMLTQQLRERERYLQELNRSLELANQELSRKNEELETFNFIASHDLQEPLRKIQVYSNRIVETGLHELSPSVRENFGRINAASKRMQKLIEDFLLFSQTANTSQPEEVVDLNKIVEEVKGELITRIEEKKASISVSPLPKVHGVPFQLKQLLVNLVSNSLKYTHDGIAPQITISGGIVEGSKIDEPAADPGTLYAMVSVADNGIGFDPKYRKKIFELFQRLHGKNVYSGTGIGLALCRKVVQNLNGFIRAESEPGKGSVFTFYVPSTRTSESVA